MNPSNNHLALKATQEKLQSSGKEFVEFFSHGSRFIVISERISKIILILNKKAFRRITSLS